MLQVQAKVKNVHNATTWCLTARKKREYYKKNPDKARRRNLLTYYGLTLEERIKKAIDRRLPL